MARTGVVLDDAKGLFVAVRRAFAGLDGVGLVVAYDPVKVGAVKANKARPSANGAARFGL